MRFRLLSTCEEKCAWRGFSENITRTNRINVCDAATFYGAGAADPAVGYTDYPFLD
jgi:hypothetical protein